MENPAIDQAEGEVHMLPLIRTENEEWMMHLDRDNKLLI
jgi:hypothetical protein